MLNQRFESELRAINSVCSQTDIEQFEHLNKAFDTIKARIQQDVLEHSRFKQLLFFVLLAFRY